MVYKHGTSDVLPLAEIGLMELIEGHLYKPRLFGRVVRLPCKLVCIVYTYFRTHQTSVHFTANSSNTSTSGSSLVHSLGVTSKTRRPSHQHQRLMQQRWNRDRFQALIHQDAQR